MYTSSQNSYFLHFRCFTGRLKGTCHVMNKSRAHFKYVQAHVCLLNQCGHCQNTCSSNAIAGSSSPISRCECLLRTQRSCHRAACHAGPTCPVSVVSTVVRHVPQRFQVLHKMTPSALIFHLFLLGPAVGAHGANVLTSVLNAM